MPRVAKPGRPAGGDALMVWLKLGSLRDGNMNIFLVCSRWNRALVGGIENRGGWQMSNGLEGKGALRHVI